MKRKTQFALCGVWLACVFFWLGTQPPEVEAFPQPSQNIIPPRRIYNLELADGVNQGMRDFWQKPDEVLNRLGDLEGKHIADIGAGQGYFTLRLLSRIGPKGMIYANDIQERVLERLRTKVPDEYRENISFVLGNEQSTGLTEPVDWILLVQVLAEVEHQKEFLQSLKTIMRPSTRLLVIDSKHITDSNTGYTRPINLKRLEQAFAEQGLVFAPEYPVETLQFLPKQFFFVLMMDPADSGNG